MKKTKTQKKNIEWEVKKLGEVCNLIKGKKPKTFSKTGKPYLTAKSIRGGDYPQLTEEKEKVVFVNSEDIVIIMDGSNSGEMFQNLDGVLASTMGVLSFDKQKINTRFLLYFLIGYSEEFTKSRTGSAIPHLNKEQFENLLFPIIPISEQKRIVKILDEVFADIEKAKENAEKNLENAKELFESYLQGVFENKGDDWEVTTIGNSCDLLTGGTPSKAKKEYFKDGKINWLVSGDINKKEILNCEGRITGLGLKNSNAKYLPLNSVMIALNGQGKTRGTVAMLRIKATCNQSLVSIYPKDITKLLPELIFENLRGRYDEIRKLTGDAGTERRGLNMPIIRKIKISFPKSLKTQKEIVKKLDELSGRMEEYEVILRSKIADLEELKKSVLQKAFEGKL